MKNRSLMFIPAKEKMIGKISEFKADLFIIDLEDSIEKNEKENALNVLFNYLDTLEKRDNIVVRVNSDNYNKEIKLLDKFSEISFMLPKFEKKEQYNDVEEILLKHKNIALVESPLGIVNIDKIVELEYITAIAFGAEDYTANVNMKNCIETLNYAKSKIVTYSKAYGKKVFDTPSFKLNDEVEFKKEVNSSVDLGFDGKLLIHPKHIEYINEAFDSIDIEKYKEIIEKYKQNGEAVVVIDGKVYEKMHISRMEKILREKEGM